LLVIRTPELKKGANSSLRFDADQLLPPLRSDNMGTYYRVADSACGMLAAVPGAMA
jgi:hypothetical protein